MRKSILFVEIIYVALIEQDGFSSTYESIVFLDVALHYIISNRVICYGVYVGLEGHFSFLLSFIFMLFPILLFFFCSLISVLYIRAVSYSHFVNSLILPIYFFNFCPIYSALWFLPFFLRFERLLSWIYSWHFIYKRSFHFTAPGRYCCWWTINPCGHHQLSVLLYRHATYLLH